MSQNKIKFDGREWDVLKDCGTFYVAHIGDEVRNISKKEENGTPSKPSNK